MNSLSREICHRSATQLKEMFWFKRQGFIRDGSDQGRDFLKYLFVSLFVFTHKEQAAVVEKQWLTTLFRFPIYSLTFVHGFYTLVNDKRLL